MFSPKSGLLSTPEGKNLETLEKPNSEPSDSIKKTENPVQEPPCSIRSTGNPDLEPSGSIRSTGNPDLEPAGSTRSTGNPDSDDGTESSGLQTKNLEPGVQNVPEPGTKEKVQNQSNEKESN